MTNAEPIDPKEQMRQALEAKKAAHHKSAEAGAGGKKVGQAQGPVGGRRQFRRKAGG